MQDIPSRKRPAPGSVPQPQATNMNAQQNSVPRFSDISDPSQLSNDQFLSWSAGNNISAINDNSRITQLSGNAHSGSSNAAMSQLVKRSNSSQALGQSRISSLPENRGSPTAADDSDEDDGELEARAAAAKKEALSRRPPKQIPPFIQKLSSFLDDPANANLIRWADDGRSFVIPDEEKFANDLIPLMFKHNNYASFVRQLNMYGFHKKVGLSDNSMRASEKKTKIPSGYQHKYFRQGRPELQWLIEKPKPGSIAAKKRSGKDAEDDEGQDFEDRTTGRPSNRSTDLVSMPKADLANVRNLQKEVESLQRSQQQIYSILKQMRDENNQYIKQASTMVANHERHESSINAILQFLATFYNQSLQGRDNVSNMFSSQMPRHQQQQGGNVVEDMGEYTDSPQGFDNVDRRTPQPRRPLALLPAPAAVEELGDNAAPTSASPASRQRTETKSPRVHQRAGSADSSKDSSPKLGAGRNVNADILNVINRSNQQQGGGTPRFDFSSALRNYSDGANGSNGPLTPEQRDTMLSIMASHSGTNTPGISKPDKRDPSVQSYIDLFKNNEEQLSMLQRLQEEQDSRVQELAGRLQPLSPNGSIPGLDVSPSPSAQQNPGLAGSYSGSYNPNSDGYDFSTFLNDDPFPDGTDLGDGAGGAADYAWDDINNEFTGAGDGAAGRDALFDDTFDLNGDGLGDDAALGGGGDEDGEFGEQTGGRIVGSVTSSGAPTPRAPSVSVKDEGDEEDDYGSGSKRRKVKG